MYNMIRSSALVYSLVGLILIIGTTGCRGWYQKKYLFRPSIHDRAVIRALVKDQKIENEKDETDSNKKVKFKYNGMNVELKGNVIKITNLGISIPVEKIKIYITDTDILQFSNDIKLSLRKRMNFAKFARLSSGTVQILSAAAGASLGIIAGSDVETISALSLTSAIIPKLQSIWKARARAVAYGDGLELIDKAEARYFATRVIAHQNKQEEDKDLGLISIDKLTKDGVRLMGEIAAIIKTIDKVILSHIPTLEDLKAATGELESQLDDLKVLPKNMSLSKGDKGTFLVVHGGPATAAVSNNETVASVDGFVAGSNAITIQSNENGESDIVVMNKHGHYGTVTVHVLKAFQIKEKYKKITACLNGAEGITYIERGTPLLEKEKTLKISVSEKGKSVKGVVNVELQNKERVTVKGLKVGTFTVELEDKDGNTDSFEVEVIPCIDFTINGDVYKDGQTMDLVQGDTIALKVDLEKSGVKNISEPVSSDSEIVKVTKSDLEAIGKVGEDAEITIKYNIKDYVGEFDFKLKVKIVEKPEVITNGKIETKSKPQREFDPSKISLIRRIGKKEANNKFGRLTFLGGIDMDYLKAELSNDFGTLSGMVIPPTDRDGRKDSFNFIAVSDQGFWFTAKLTEDSDRKPTGFMDVKFPKMLDTGNKPMVGDKRDAEAVSISPKGKIIVSYERSYGEGSPNRLLSYSLENGVFSKAKNYFTFSQIDENQFGKNKGIEAISFYAGNELFMISETPEERNNKKYFPGWFLKDGKEKRKIYLEQIDGLWPKGLAELPDGTLVLLEHKVHKERDSKLSDEEIKDGIKYNNTVKISRLSMRNKSVEGVGEVLDRELLHKFENKSYLDNFEGIAARMDTDDSTVIYILSDNNKGSDNQETLLLKFRIEK